MQQATKMVSEKAPIPGTTLADHCESVIASNLELVGRCKKVHELRAKKDRRLSRESRQRMLACRDSMRHAADELDVVLNQEGPITWPRITQRLKPFRRLKTIGWLMGDTLGDVLMYLQTELVALHAKGKGKIWN